MNKPFIFRLTEPILIKLHRRYVEWFPTYRYRSVKVKVPLGVFHPAMVYSTRAMLNYLEGINLTGKRVLDLGTGSGILAIVCALRGAFVTASDINPLALEACRMNADNNGATVTMALSDLFDDLPNGHFDLIIINPPYYPADAEDMPKRAWFCGSDFGYYHRLFGKNPLAERPMTEIVMVLGETAPVEAIMQTAQLYHQCLDKVASSRHVGEWFYIYRLRSI